MHFEVFGVGARAAQHIPKPAPNRGRRTGPRRMWRSSDRSIVLVFGSVCGRTGRGPRGVPEPARVPRGPRTRPRTVRTGASKEVFLFFSGLPCVGVSQTGSHANNLAGRILFQFEVRILQASLQREADASEANRA